jgi:hypothetical protein
MIGFLGRPVMKLSEMSLAKENRVRPGTCFFTTIETKHNAWAEVRASGCSQTAY